ncbi:MAG: UPF0149 family protein [Woeseiaceae bacterium]
MRIPQSSKAEHLTSEINHSALESALQRCGSSWTASQAHGLICSRLALLGANAVDPWLQQVLQDADAQNALRHECAGQLRMLHDETWQQLAERGSEFQLLLPGDSEGAVSRTEALAHWCEGFLHGLVVRADGDELKARLSAEPLSDIIRDMLEITRAEADPDADDETNEVAYAELLEYLRVAAQLVYEELAEFRRPQSSFPDAGAPGLTH